MLRSSFQSGQNQQTGVVNRKLGSAKTIKLTDSSRACRDIVGAFNFFLKTLVVDTPTFNYVQLITIYKKKSIGVRNE
ncbi:MAG: hypothetical protein D3921_10630 [Candidatus Electrothrix sp. AW1]|nr:hypothetical protein [Candidatus Electrothrix sp. AX1]MCI5182947.1 hypothetical protein [Candidatus Electrothrix gigas]